MSTFQFERNLNANFEGMVALTITSPVERAPTMSPHGHACPMREHLNIDDMQGTLGATPVMSCINSLVTSLAQIYLGEREKLELPLPSLPQLRPKIGKHRQCSRRTDLCGWSLCLTYR